MDSKTWLHVNPKEFCHLLEDGKRDVEYSFDVRKVYIPDAMVDNLRCQG